MSEDPHQHIARLIDAAQPIGLEDEIDADGEIDVGDEVLPAAVETGPNGPVPRVWGFDMAQMNREWALVLMGSKAVIVHEQTTGPIEDRVRVLTLDAFRAWFLNTRTEYVGADGRIKAVTWATAWLQSRARRHYRGIEFKPDPDHVEGAAGYLNLWRGFAVVPKAKVNGYAVLRDHLFNNCCGGNPELFAWVFAWFAHIVQRPRERVGTALVMRGRMGTGKTKVGEAIGSLFPSHYFLVDDARYVTGNFNAHMASCLLLQAEEAVWAGDKNAEGRLKSLVTARTQMIESKGVDPIRLDNYVRLLMTSNEDWVIPAGKDERRFCVLDIDPRCAQNHAYFRDLDAELDDGGRAALLYDLLNLDLSKINLRRIPMTEALLEQKLRSLDSVESWWVQRLYAGSPLKAQPDWPPEVPCEVLFDDYLNASERIGIKRKAEEIAFGMKLRKLVPELGRQKRFHEDTARRRWCYILPSLTTCREAFTSAVGQDPGWPDSDP